YDGKFYMVNCAHKKDGARTTIVGLSVELLDKPLEEKSQFELKGQSGKHYAVRIAAILFVLTSLAALIVCIMERGLHRKWAWILFILFGIGDLTLNWGTGETTFSLLTLQIFSAGTTTGAYGELVL